MKVFIVSCVLLSVAVAHQIPSGEPSILNDCFEKDSIGCIQTTVYRRAREFFDQPSIQFFGGISFAKTNARAAKSIAPEVEQATTVQAREAALEDYLVDNVKNFFTERQLTWDMATAGRSIANAIPDEVKETVRELVYEGRTKKKILKKIKPFLGILKLKLAALAVLAVGFIGFLAKKALIISFLAIAIAKAAALSSLIAKFIGLGSGLKGKIGGIAGGSKNGGGLGGILSGLAGGNSASASNDVNVEEIIAYTQAGNGGSGWSSGAGNNGGWSSGGNAWADTYEHGAHSQPIAHAIAYSGQQPHRRR